MNYRHAYHAGNFADVHKHVALVAALMHLRKKETPFAVIDTHAGRGLYDLAADESVRTRESEAGVARFAGVSSALPALQSYLDIVRSFGVGRYPGSPLIAARLLRPQDRLLAVEKHPAEFVMLRKSLAPFAPTKALQADAYDRLPSLLPPPERRGLVLIDPPYESPDECEDVVRAFKSAIRRFATGIYLIWHPPKAAARFDALAGEIGAAGGVRLLSLMLDNGARAAPERLSASGLLVVNPPYEFDTQMRAISAELLSHLGQGPKARAGVEWIGQPSDPRLAG